MKKVQAPTKWFDKVGWRILIVGIVFIGIMAIIVHGPSDNVCVTDYNISGDSGFCKIMFKADQTTEREFNNSLKECSSMVNKACDAWHPKPFCSLCTSFWDECQADEKAKARFEAECECTDRNVAYLEPSIIYTETDGKINKLGYVCTNDNTILDPIKEVCIFYDECLSAKEKTEIKRRIDCNGIPIEVTYDKEAYEDVSCSKKEITQNDTELKINYVFLKNGTPVNTESLNYTYYKDAEEYCLHNTQDIEVCECVEWSCPEGSELNKYDKNICQHCFGDNQMGGCGTTSSHCTKAVPKESS